MLRPRPARWFEILAARDDATLVLEALARTGAIELEAQTGIAQAEPWAEVLPLLLQFLELQTRHHAYWPPAPACRPSRSAEAPVASLQHSLRTIRAWALEAEPWIRSLQGAQAEQIELQLWQQVLQELQMPQSPQSPRPHGIGGDQLAAAGPWLGVRLFVLPPGVDADAVLQPPAELVATQLLINDALHVLAAGQPAALQALAQAVTALKGTMHAVPPWLQADAGLNLQEVGLRLAAQEQAIVQARQALAALNTGHDLARALGDANRLQWMQHNVRALQAQGLLCWITGWCSDTGDTGDAQDHRIAHALHASGARALLRFAPPPPAARPPLLLDNPAWARPFEIFSRALGMPAATEADPSPLLAVAVPLLFGYMFGDVGQGLLIAAVGFWARERWPMARLLIVGGLSAALFGLVFGSVFSLHGLLPALWLQPLDSPLDVLLVPVLGGAVLLTLGLALDALSAFWRGEGRRWWLTDAALVVIYLGLLGAAVSPAGPLVAIAGLLWFCAGHGWLQRKAGAALAAAGQALEKTLQILINTLSFARVGAFALAHAGLSSAIVALMAAADSTVAQGLVLVLGNALVIVLEALVVSIQTTRLVLFEFFTRFMQGQGRAFRPLPPPPFTTQEN